MTLATTQLPAWVRTLCAKQTAYLCGFVFAVLAGPAFASGDRVDVSTQAINSGSKSYGFGSTDVDINDCLSSYSLLFGLWQNVRVNPLCVADKLNQAGKYDAAAVMYCSVRRVKKVYGKDCIEKVKHDESDTTPLVYAAPAVEDTQYYEDEYKALRESQAQLAAEVAKARKDAQRARVEAQRAYERPIMQTDLQQQLSMDAIRRANAREVLKGDK